MTDPTPAGTDDAPLEFGVGPAYPTSHTSFTDDRASAGTHRPFASGSADAGPSWASRAVPSDEPVFSPSPDFSIADGVRDVGMVCMGASTTAGYGDPKGLGWVGRVVARTQHPDLDLTAYNLGVRGNTSGDVVARWNAECHPRWQGRAERRLVLSVGSDDVLTGMTMARSRLNLANVLDEAANSGIGRRRPKRVSV